MFIPFQNEPRLISLPVLASTPDLFYDVELAHAIDASNARTGALHVRLHTRLSANNKTAPRRAILMVLAFPILPFDSAVDTRFQGPTAVLTAGGNGITYADSPAGTLVVGTPADLCVPALRIVLRLTTDEQAATVEDSISLSGGVVLTN